MDSGHETITLQQFINCLFPSPRGIVDLVEAVPGRDKAVFFVDHNGATYDRVGPSPLYVCISTCESVGPRSRKPSRKHPVATYVIVLDDIGTKVPVDRLPAVRPTYALETSPGNFQIGFRLSEPAEPARAAALIDALAGAGYSDPGAKSDVRLVRVPGSMNGKPQHGDWTARLTTWNPDVSYTYSELAILFKVTPSDTSPRSSVPELAPGESDPIAEWIVAHQGATGGASGPPVRGLIPVICPQHELHTVGTERSNDSSTVWIPGSPGAFKCTHGHCADFRTREYLGWLKQAHPDDQPAAAHPVDMGALGAAIRAAAGAVGAGGGLFRPRSADDVRETVLGDLVKVGSKDRYFTISGQEYMTRAGVDDHWYQRMNDAGLLEIDAGVDKNGDPKTKIIAPHIWLRWQPDTLRTAKVVHRLGQGAIVDGDLNVAPPIPARPAADGEPGPWLELVDHICGGDGRLADLVIDWCSMVAGDWTQKTGWHLLMRGPSGSGKNLLLEPLRTWMGDGNAGHHQRIEVSKISGSFHPFLMKRLVTLDELKMNTRGAMSMHDVYTILKAWTTRGNHTMDVNIKFGELNCLDLSCWVITSNDSVPMPLDDDDRRFLVIEPPAPKPEQFYTDILAWYRVGGAEQVVGWLCRQWDALDEGRRQVLYGRAPMTAAKRVLIEGSSEGIPGAVRLATTGSYGVMWPELITLHDAEDSLRMGSASSYLPDAYRKLLSHQRIAQALRGAGWVQLFGGNRVEVGTTRIRLWCRTALRAVLYEQMGQGKRLLEAYQRMKAIGGASASDDLARAEFNPFGAKRDEKNEE